MGAAVSFSFRTLNQPLRMNVSSESNHRLVPFFLIWLTLMCTLVLALGVCRGGTAGRPAGGSDFMITVSASWRFTADVYDPQRKDSPHLLDLLTICLRSCDLFPKASSLGAVRPVSLRFNWVSI